MPGNSRRRGAVRKSSKGNPTAGSGGRRNRGLAGKGPTPPAQDRPNHKKYQGSGGKGGSGGGGKGGPRSRSGRGQDADQPEWVAGRNAVLELLRAGVPVTAVYVADGVESDDRLREALRWVQETGARLEQLSRTELDRRTRGAAHQGIAAQVPPYSYAEPDALVTHAQEAGEPPLIVALDQVTDPRNLGAVVRSTAAFGGHGVVVPQRRSAQMTAAAWKASAGAAARVPVARTVNLARQLTAYQQAGCMVVGLAGDGDVALPDLTLGDGPLVLVVGSEGEGLSRLVSQRCDQRVAVPLTSTVESLNASVAASVALYAVAQARSAGPDRG